MKGIMIQGTSSDSGKSFLATGLCRILSDMGYRVCPFKSQNMSNNSCVTKNGLEMGRAQAAQAEAARVDPEVFMNPILLKPRKDTSSEIVLMGKVLDAPAGPDYYRSFTMGEGLAAVREALAHIEKNFDIAVIEGAGSPAEVNLNAAEIVNMRVAREADVPVILTADVDRGGALASVVGTLELLGGDRERVKGIIFNKFRGDLSLFEPAVRWTEERTGVRVAGVMPWAHDIRIAGEDSLSIRWSAPGASAGVTDKTDKTRKTRQIRIGVVRLPYISNYTDLEPFAAEPDTELTEVDETTPLGGMDALIIPGTKSTVQDMKALRGSGLAARLVEFYERGGTVFGLCGGYQMLGLSIDDRFLRDNGELREISGLGLLPVVTDFAAEKKTAVQSKGRMIHPASQAYRAYQECSISDIPVEGYEIHFGETRRASGAADDGRFHPLFVLNGREDGLSDAELRAAGTYLHNVFHSDAFRALWLNALRRRAGLAERPPVNTAAAKEKTYDSLAARMKEHLDMEYILKLAGIVA